jgi:tetratricopeptide (TPR) repeat protein
VGVELEVPGNIWGLANPPEDWREPAKPKSSEGQAFEKEMKELIALAETGTYYQLLRTSADSPRTQVRQSYYGIMRKFHPDLHMDRAEWTQPLHRLTEAVTLAYKTLTDETARRKYDERLASSSTFTLRRQQSDLQKTAEECIQKARECLKAQNPGGTILWLRKATELEPKSDKYHALLARTLSRVAPLRREAIEHFEKALEIDPSNTTVRLQVATLYEEMKLPWRARLHYQKVLEIDADNPKAQKRLRLLDADPSKDDASKRSIADRILHRSPR